MSGPGRPRKQDSEKLVSFGVRVPAHIRKNALTYPLDHQNRKDVKSAIEKAYEQPYTGNVLKEEA